MYTTQITRKVEFDAGHRIPSHDSKCRNVHGHRYVLEVTIEGPVKANRGLSDDGMVVDFSNIKQILNDLFVDKWDHAFLVYELDSSMRAALESLFVGHNTVVLPFIPTAEKLAEYVFDTLSDYLILVNSPCKVFRVKLYETPNCFAEIYAAKRIR